MRNHTSLVLICLLGICLPGFGQQQEVTIGAQVWAYDRVYPLLDGLLQDAASTQLQQLVLDPNKANSSQLDALIQSFQVQAGFNQLSGVQNSAAAQMAVANLGYQSALAEQQQSIVQQSITAQQALTKANQDLAAATASQSQPQINVANLEVQNAQALVNGLAAESATVKGSGTPWTASAASGNIAANPTAFTSGVPSAVLGAGSSSAGPSFPATKQLDNQMDLLWSRLARVVGAMARPDSIGPDSNMYLIELDTATFPNKHEKGRILDTRYSLTCGQVVDLFPRVAAVNVANTKYRDNADIFGVMLSWFSFGINAAYNREHLKMSQTLGQSSYITGYGIDQKEFGWKFGIPLGDNFVSSDTKRTFALISAPPSSCQAPTLTLKEVAWEKPDGSRQVKDTEHTPADFAAVNNQMNASASPGDAASVAETSISFNRASYDPTKYTSANAVLVAVSIALKEPIDQQATVYANGILLKRARDTFGRAIPNGSGSGGLLEESVSIGQANTWIPISPKNLLLTLDAGQFGAVFPTIQINSPGQISPALISPSAPADVKVTVSGQPIECLTKTKGACQLPLPSLAYQVPVNTSLGVILWQTNCIPLGSGNCTDYIVLQAPPAQTSTNLSTANITQVVSGASVNPWGVSPEVYLSVPTQSQKQYRLDCNLEGSVAVGGRNMVCKFWDGNTSPEFTSEFDALYDLNLQVIDQGHAGGALLASAVLPASAWGKTTSAAPSLWSASNIQWRDGKNGGSWEFQLQFANVDKNKALNILPNQGSHTLPTPTCDAGTGICTWDFTITPEDIPNWSDRMDVSFQGDPDNTWQLLNIRSQISPHVTVMSADFSSWSGNNFTRVFSSANDQTNKTGLMIGRSLIPIDCPVLNSCVVSDPTKLPANAGVMYLAALNQKFPLLQVNSDGTTQPITFQPPPKNNNGAPQTNPNSSAPSETSTHTPNTIVIGGSNK